MGYGHESWSAQEDAILMAHYPTGGSTECISLLSARTIGAIRARAQDLGLRFAGSRELIHVNEPFAIELYRAHRDMKKVAQLMGVGLHIVERVMRKHQVTLKGSWAIDTDREAIVADYTAARLSNAQIALKHGYPKSTLKKALTKWGVQDPNRHQRLRDTGLYPPNRKSPYQCWVERFGVAEADKRRARMNAQQGSSGASNPMHNKPSPQGAGNGWKGWYRGHYFRSLREACCMLSLDQAGIEWQTGETLSIPYAFLGVQRTYRPDYVVGTQLLEVKPTRLHDTPQVSAKHVGAEAYCAAKGLTYELVDVTIDAEAVYEAWATGLVRFSHDYEQRFLAYCAKLG